MSARQGLPILHELVTRWTFRRRLLAAVGAEPDLFAITDDAGAAGAGGAAGREQRHEAAARMAAAWT
jgi:hypothetical protein